MRAQAACFDAFELLIHSWVVACPAGQSIEQAIRDHGELHDVVFNL